jgi:murein DD-endopeptidase MepM/ murein hydrolase activator NlpD
MRFFSSFLIIIVILSSFFYLQNHSSSSNAPVQSLNQTQNTPDITTSLVDPIADFKSRITKKPFGIYVTPKNSPVQPERFTGYHTGTDVEYGDVTIDVPVHSITDGQVIYSGWVSGYGGVIVIRYEINGQTYTGLFGHLKPSSLLKVNTLVKKGDQIGVLGTAYSHDTDGERRHLHFALHKGQELVLLGYVPKESELSGWVDPLTLY